MPQQTKQTLAITAAQSVASLMLRLQQLHDDVNAFLVTNTNQSYDTTWQALPTVAFNTDGTTATQDGSANNAHPINVPSGSPLLIARNDLLTSVGCLTNFQSFMVGTAVGTQTNTPRKYADLLNK